MKQDHFTTAAESASARNTQRDGVQGSDKRSMRGLCMCFDKIQRKAIHAKDRVHNRACTPLWLMKQDHFATAAESASARNRQRDGVQGYDKRLMRGLCMCFKNIQSKVIHAKKKDRVQKRACAPSWRTKKISQRSCKMRLCAKQMGISRSSKKRPKRGRRKRYEPLPNQEI